MKKFWIAVAIVAAVGFVCGVCGLAMGPELGAYWDLSGVHRAGGFQNIAETLDAPVTDIDLQVSSATVTFAQSDHYGYEVTNMPADNPITFQFDGRTLTVRQNIDWWHLRLFSFWTPDPAITIYLPPDAALNTVNLQFSSGSVTVNGLNAQQVQVRFSSGSLTIADVQADTLNVQLTSGTARINNTTAGSVTMGLSSGTLTASGLVSQGFALTVTSGSATLDGTFTGANTVRVSSGSARMTVHGNKADYSRDIAVSSGMARVDGSGQNLNDSNTGAANSLYARISSGSFRVDFVE
ncbi:MAG: DUF4097 domain-containing protein [Oscillospiraceae bacterium]|nr:DUF4097 domain-containing protein [Oscillospiraceae bacterium]